MKKTLLFLFVTSLLLGCKKYPDGPLLSLRTKEHRMVGVWDVEYFSIEGYDSTAYVKNNPLYSKYTLKKGDYGSGDFIYHSNDNSYITGGGWGFSNNNKDLRLTLQNTITSNNVGPYGARDVTWEIRRLKENELWLKTIYNGKEYFVKFKQ